MAVEVSKRLFNVAEYYRMADAGILSEDDRVELIEGEIVEMSPIGVRHQACVDRLTRLLHLRVGRIAIIRVQGPIRLGEYSEPQPDLALLRLRNDHYTQGHPMPADVLLVIEVAETTREYDRNVKIPLYAQAGIPEAWLVDIPEGVIYVYWQPSQGAYQQVRRFQRGETLTSPTLPRLTLNVDDILD
jgi:Uma2 family endonuclease